MDKGIILRGNHAFFFAAVGMAMCSHDVFEAVFSSLNNDGKAQVGIERGSYSGYLAIDATDIIRNCSHGCLMRDLNERILTEVGNQIPYGNLVYQLMVVFKDLFNKALFSWWIGVKEVNKIGIDHIIYGI